MSRPPVRLIARLDIKAPSVVKGVQLEGLRIVGQPSPLAMRYYEQGIDELIFIDIVASLYQRNNILEIISEAARDAFLPITVGGGIRTLDDIYRALRHGADKVAINTAAIASPKLIEEAANAFGSQCIVLSVEAKRRGSSPANWEAMTNNGRERTGVDVVKWIVEAERLGAGEILLTSVDREGLARGMDIELLSTIHDRVRIPVVASGGVGSAKDVVDVFTADAAEAVACAHVLHYGLETVGSIKDALSSAGIRARRKSP